MVEVVRTVVQLLRGDGGDTRWIRLAQRMALGAVAIGAIGGLYWLAVATSISVLAILVAILSLLFCVAAVG